jgi:hypothetical protein
MHLRMCNYKKYCNKKTNLLRLRCKLRCVQAGIWVALILYELIFWIKLPHVAMLSVQGAQKRDAFRELFIDTPNKWICPISIRFSQESPRRLHGRDLYSASGDDYQQRALTPGGHLLSSYGSSEYSNKATFQIYVSINHLNSGGYYILCSLPTECICVFHTVAVQLSSLTFFLWFIVYFNFNV